ncbi:MAG: hypothetical protein CMC78_03140 [Flavobacteriaceae bacterium]|nr:hypothetical protein [Flavobacteriaceae bacterium]
MIFFSLSYCKKEGAGPENEIEDTTVDVTLANPPILRTPYPVIHLADNLDEQDQLGYCIDTRGRGFNEELHAHSCKARGGDVQFFFNKETLQICSVEFTGYCIEMPGGASKGMSLRLFESDTSSSDQKFVYNEDSGEFVPEENLTLCLAVGETSAAAGIYMSRSLTLELSSETDVKLKQWVIHE